MPGSEPAMRLGFLEPHHLEAARRVARLFERAHLMQRTTIRYTPQPAAGRNTGVHGQITDMAADARAALAQIHRLLPADCASVVMDVCCYEKGLQAIEAERGWPRRSAKLVLRIGLDHLAAHFGLSPVARGPRAAGTAGWMAEGAKPMEFG
ncbi:DUF6456 domain-containing protein [Pelagibacterium limicola]|uniref:DUF6456 domain-containing protein n=1 Tax=Pelagibacterium limicola TaxID=2791022 RepID=UPI0018AF6510|nr:DUF6456 domain-containing protein [Pelagibacterium limicola]